MFWRKNKNKKVEFRCTSCGQIHRDCPVFLTLFLLLFFSIQIHSQNKIDVYGTVLFCNLESGDHIILKTKNNSLQNKVVDVYKIKKGKIRTKTLNANIKVYFKDSLLYDIMTNSKGSFKLKNLKRETLDFKIKIDHYLKQDYRITLGGAKKQSIKLCISDSILKAKSDSTILSSIPYNAFKAEEDIKNGNIYILQLISGDSFLNNSDYEYLEKRFGFKFLYADFSNFPNKLLIKAQNDYNNVVFKYLNNKCGCDFETEYSNEIKRIFNERFTKTYYTE